MYVTRHRGTIVVLLAAVIVAACAPGGSATAASSWTQVDAVAGQTGAAVQHVVTSGGLPATGLAMEPLVSSQDLTPTATVTPTATLTPTATVTATATTPPPPTATATSTPRPKPSSTPRPKPSSTPRPKPSKTPTPPPPPTNTPVPTATPTPRPLSVHLLSVGVYTIAKGHEKRVTKETLGTQVRLKIVVAVANAPRSGVSVRATWALGNVGGTRTYYKVGRVFVLHNGSAGLFDDLVLPTRDFATGAYLFTGSISYHGIVQQRATMLHVLGQLIVVTPMRVHYAHLRLTVPAGWHLDFERDSTGRPVTGRDSLLMLSGSRLTLVDAVSVGLNSTPTTAELHDFPAQLLAQEFPTGVTNVKPIFFKGQIDGHDVFAAQGDVTINKRKSQAVAIVTAKKRQFYTFTLVNYFKHAPQSELHAGFTSIFGAKLD